MCSAIGQDVGQLVSDVVISPGIARSVQLRGELDLNTAPRLEQLLDRLRGDGHRQVIVFLRADQALSEVGGAT